MKTTIVLALMVLAGCTHPFRTVSIDATVHAYEVTPVQGQDAAQTQAAIAACRQKLLDEPGDLEPYEGGAMAIATEVERGKRYVGCLRERGYTAAQRPMR